MDLGAVVSRSEPLQSYQLGNAHSNTSITSTAPGHFMNPEWKAAAALVRGPQSQPPFPSNSPQPSTSVLPSLHPHSPLHITSHHHQPETQTQAAVSSATSTNPEPSANAEPPAEEELKAIESRRKESHKEVEKRRRNQINQGIQRLLTMLPPLPFPSPSQESPNSAPSQPSSAAQNGAYSASVPSSGNLTSHAKQANKAIILDSAANYIQHLKEVEQSNIDKWTVR